MNEQNPEVLDLEPIVISLAARTTEQYDATFVRTVVEKTAHEFDNVRVRDFLPVLIAKESADELRRMGAIGNIGM